MNRLKSIRGGTGRFNIVSVPIYLIIIAAVYIGWKYVPIYWERERLDEIAQNAMMSAHRYGNLEIRTFILDMAKEELGLIIKPEDVRITRSKKRITVEVDYQKTVNHPFGRSTVHDMRMTTTRRIIDF